MKHKHVFEMCTDCVESEFLNKGVSIESSVASNTRY